METRYLVMYENAIKVGTVEDPNYTYYYKTYEKALREGEKWLEYRPPVRSRRLQKGSWPHGRICQFFTIQERYYTVEYCKEWFNEDGSQKDKRQ